MCGHAALRRRHCITRSGALQADKAPLEIVAIFKALVEDRDVLLGDGRRLVGAEIVEAEGGCDEKTIVMHSEFKIWVLANRPGACVCACGVCVCVCVCVRVCVCVCVCVWWACFDVGPYRRLPVSR